MGQRLDLQAILAGLDGVTDAYFQPKQNIVLEYPCIVYQRSDSRRFSADNIMYHLKKRYDVTVIDRDPDSLIPDQVEGLPNTRFDRFFVRDGLNHHVYNLFF